VYKKICINKTAERRQEEEQLRQRLDEAIVNLQGDPTNEHWQGVLAACIDNFQRIERQKVEGQLLRSRVKWKTVKDQYSKEFI
jgi:hypothetical protein